MVAEPYGHDNEAPEQIHLTGLDTSVVYKANSIILKSL